MSRGDTTGRGLATTPAALGHNQGPPLEPASAWNAYCWRKARKAVWKTPSIEVVRRRVRRAEDLGLSYEDYTAVVLDRGTHPNALFFDLGGTLADIESRRTRRGAAASIRPLQRAIDKLSALRDCKTFVVANLAELAAGLVTADQAGRFIEELNRLCNAVITDHRVGADPAGATGGFLKPAPGMIAELLAAHDLAPAAAIMIGGSEMARQRAEAARLARFIWAGDYFGREP